MKLSLKNLPALALLLGALVLMQHHAMAFWSQYAGDMGVLWSLLLEGAALWLWAQRSLAKNALALVASVLVLAGPLYQVSAPALAQYQQSQAAPEAHAKQEQSLLAQREALSASLATYNANSSTRAGWAGRIDSAQAQLAEVNAKLGMLYSQKAEPFVWQSLVVVGMQLCALLIFQVLIVLCIRSLSAPSRQALNSQAVVDSSTQSKAAAPVPLVKRAAATMRRSLAA